MQAVPKTCSILRCMCRQRPLLSICHVQGISLQLLWLTGEAAEWGASPLPCCSPEHLSPSTSFLSLDCRSPGWERMLWQCKVGVIHKRRAHVLLERVIGCGFIFWNPELRVLIYMHKYNLYSNPTQHLDVCLIASLWAWLKKHEVEHLQKHF